MLTYDEATGNENTRFLVGSCVYPRLTVNNNKNQFRVEGDDKWKTEKDLQKSFDRILRSIGLAFQDAQEKDGAAKVHRLANLMCDAWADY